MKAADSPTTVPDEAGETKCFPGTLFKKVTNNRCNQQQLDRESISDVVTDNTVISRLLLNNIRRKALGHLMKFTQRSIRYRVGFNLG